MRKEKASFFFFDFKITKMPRRTKNSAGTSRHTNWPAAEEYCDTIVAFDDTEQVTNGSLNFKEHGLQMVTVI